MMREEESSVWMDSYQAEDLSAKMKKKSKHIPPPLNLSAVGPGDSDASNSPLKDFAMLATSPRSPLVQKNLPFRKRAHSYSSTQTSSECDSPDSPRVPASPVAAAPSPSPFTPLSSPNLLGKKFLTEPINALLPSPNTSASFFNNECDPIKSPCLSFYRHVPELLSLPTMDKNSLKSPLQTPTRSVFLQNQVDHALFFTDMDKLPLKSPLNTPTPRTISHQAHNDDVFVMPEPISIKSEPAEPEKENLANCEMKAEPRVQTDFYNNRSTEMDPPLDLTPIVHQEVDIKREPSSPVHDRSHDRAMNYYVDTKLYESFPKMNNKNYFISQNLGLYCSELTNPTPMHNFHEPRGKPASYKPQTYRKTSVPKRPAEKIEGEAPKKTKKELDEERPRRPMNAFMLFAKHQRPLLIQQHPGKDNRAISVVLGNAWRELDATERADYVRRAAAMALEHKRRHPDCWKRRRVRVTNNMAPAPGSGPALITAPPCPADVTTAS